MFNKTIIIKKKKKKKSHSITQQNKGKESHWVE